MIILGELTNDAATKLEGWCWAPDRPTERRIVEIYVNGHLAVSAISARMNTELRERGIGDGYHGFSMPMPQVPVGSEESLIIEARERHTGTTFGRIVIQDKSSCDPIETRLTKAEHSAYEVLHSLGRYEAEPKAKSFASALHAIGSSLISQSIQQKRANTLSEISLPWIPNPRFTLILPALPQWRQTRDALRGLYPLLSTHRAEIILADDGRDPQTAILGARIRNLNYVLQPGAVIPRLNIAARMGRGQTLCILSSTKSSVRVFLDALGTLPPNQLILGSQPATIVRELGYAKAWPSSLFGVAAANLQTVLDRHLFISTGGFDRRLPSPLLAFADLALKSRLLGHTPTLWQECEGPHTLLGTGPIYQHRRVLLERWPA
ncbi:hypothetical protein [Acidocella aminolytica]|uniref:Glycosyltransferase 2-like domain-containing protein n=1 Tax=Acidocella aminolytica 101 = DSM 11237 TaxID=1120923 RepID=A0A0D6PIQ4_9PROT|nr:hypothetical protein [Acidocella aminolytica]GAN81630.1 hypothetical protein Aam_107_008 [Acidocella aminolytica 101 = DSM 11237]GBQ40337.1 hypothetical protein AA11237_2329 [Acidocella aminolytica 101 = DSM 11237]SHF58330.1 hypothetical protein SAMN02746095_03778 [Acidocella aminolytica 101 = DSM 11237]